MSPPASVTVRNRFAVTPASHPDRFGGSYGLRATPIEWHKTDATDVGRALHLPGTSSAQRPAAVLLVAQRSTRGLEAEVSPPGKREATLKRPVLR